MYKISSELKLFLDLTKVQTEIARRLDASLGGLSLSEFIILFHLNHTNEQKLRRIDLAEKVGLTASGITRLLLPMEKIGLVKKERNERDARSSFVIMTKGGLEKFEEAVERATIFFEDKLSLNLKEKAILIKFITQLSSR